MGLCDQTGVEGGGWSMIDGAVTTSMTVGQNRSSSIIAIIALIMNEKHARSAPRNDVTPSRLASLHIRLPKATQYC